MRIQTRPHLGSVVKAGQEQHGNAEQCHADRDLRCHQSVPLPGAAPHRHALALLQYIGNVEPRGVKRGCNAGNQHGQKKRPCRKDKHAVIEANAVVHKRVRGALELGDLFRQKPGQHQAQSRARKTEQKGFHQ